MNRRTRLAAVLSLTAFLVAIGGWMGASLDEDTAVAGIEKEGDIPLPSRIG